MHFFYLEATISLDIDIKNGAKDGYVCPLLSALSKKPGTSKIGQRLWSAKRFHLFPTGLQTKCFVCRPPVLFVHGRNSQYDQDHQVLTSLSKFMQVCFFCLNHRVFNHCIIKVGYSGQVSLPSFPSLSSRLLKC
jgi:hypothetical protein